MKKFTIYFLLSLPFLGLGQTAITVANGNWTSASTWSTSAVPSTNNTAIIVEDNVIVTTNLSLSGTASLLVTGSLINPSGGAARSLSLSNFSSLTVSGNTDFEGNLTLSNSSTVTINSGYTLTVGGASFSNNTVLVINAGGSLIVNGDLSLANNNGIIDNGTLVVNGNLTASNNVVLSGSGSASVSGTSSTSNGATVFGGQGSCTNCSFTSSTPLPIELLYFNADLTSAGVDLSWATASETNNNYFTIEKSKDGINFDVLQKIKTAANNGNSTNVLHYKMQDASLYDGISFYRLKQTDFNGKYKYYDMKQVNYAKKSFASVYPNPAVNNVVINASEDYAGADIKIIDAMGREVVSEKINSTEPTSINISTLVSGVYYMFIDNGGTISKTKLFIEK
jgi:hypothetical protein